MLQGPQKQSDSITMEPGRQENRNCVLFIIILKASITWKKLAFKHLIKYYKRRRKGRRQGKEEKRIERISHSRSTALCKITGVMSHSKFRGVRCRGGALDILSTIVPYLHLDLILLPKKGPRPMSTVLCSSSLDRIFLGYICSGNCKFLQGFLWVAQLVQSAFCWCKLRMPKVVF